LTLRAVLCLEFQTAQHGAATQGRTKMAYMVRKEFDATQWLDGDFCIYDTQNWGTVFDTREQAQKFAEGNAPREVPFVIVEISDE
jgi:hypothetical protein